jgi:hypothetical protein
MKDLYEKLGGTFGNRQIMLQMSIADRLSRQCGDLSHYLRTSEPVNAGERTID